MDKKMAIAVQPKVQFKIGKFGGSFLNITRTLVPQTPGSNKFNRVFNSPVGMGVFGVEGLYECLPGFRQEPQNRPYYAIENGTKIPTQDCQGENGFRKLIDEFLQPINEDDDDFLKSDPESDYVTGVDIHSTKYGGETYEASSEHSSWSIASGIEFSLATDVDQNFKPTIGDSIKVYWSFSTDGSIPKPIIVTDNRNNQYLNIASSRAPLFIYWRNSRVYLEIRHGLNTMDYAYTVENMDGWIKTKKKNSLIISKYISANNNRVFSGPDQWYRNADAGPGIPRGRCNVMFLKDI